MRMLFPHAHVWPEIQICRQQSEEKSPQTVGEWQANLKALPDLGIKPEALHNLGRKLSYQVQLSYTHDGSDGYFDAVFHRESSFPWAIAENIPSIEAPRDWDLYANQPLQSSMSQRLEPTLRAYLQDLASPLHDAVYANPAGGITAHSQRQD